MLIVESLVFVVIWVIIYWFGTLLLIATGMGRREASFQALSAMTRTGFTTRESELAVDHPRRRRITSWLIVLGNLHLATYLVFAMLTIWGNVEAPSIVLIVITASVILLVIIAIRLGILRLINNSILRVMHRIIGQPLLERNQLLHQVGSYGVFRIAVTNVPAEAGTYIRDTGLIEVGITILAIERKRTTLPFPSVEDQLLQGDNLLCYGEVEKIPGMGE